jgi:hypothetical protein
MDVLRPAYTGTMAEAVDGRSGNVRREALPVSGASAEYRGPDADEDD